MDSELALKLSKIVHNNCKDVPHDIGITLATVAAETQAKCVLLEVDLEDDWAKIKIPMKVMDKGFHAGSVLVDFSGVQK